MISYSEILKELKELEVFLRGLGLHSGPDRLRQHARTIEMLDSAVSTGNWDQLGNPSDRGRYDWALTEGLEFVGIHRGLRDYDAAVLKALYKRALAGPANPAKETATSNDARNITFEMTLASRLRQSGARVTLGGKADMLVEDDRNRVRLFIECKRPTSLRKVPERISHGRKQLKDRLDNSDSAALGLVAVDASKLLNPQAGCIGLTAYRDIKQTLVPGLTKMHNKFSRDYDSLVDLRIVGISWHIMIPVELQEPSMTTTALQHLVFLSGPSLQTHYPITRGQELCELLDSAWSR